MRCGERVVSLICMCTMCVKQVFNHSCWVYRKLRTISGELLSLQQISEPGGVLVSNGLSAASLVERDLPSCKNSSLVHHVNAMLSTVDLQVQFRPQLQLLRL
jgi:hypothetical protein